MISLLRRGVTPLAGRRLQSISAAMRVSSECSCPATVQVVSIDASSKALVCNHEFAAGEPIFQFTGVLQRMPSRYSVAVARDAHLIGGDDSMWWEYLNHSFSPTIRVAHDPIAAFSSPPPIMSVTAAQDLEPGTMLTFDYTLHEWDMAEPFTCVETGRQCGGFLHLSDSEKDEALPRAMPHIRSLHLQHLFGQSSRC